LDIFQIPQLKLRAKSHFGGETRPQLLNDFLAQEIEDYNAYLQTLTPITLPDTTQLNELFRQTLGEVWG
jgi:hypothetical protein